MVCPACGGLLYFQYSNESGNPDHLDTDPAVKPSIWKYRDVLPVRRGSRIISLNEGCTPLRKSRKSRPYPIYFKDETLNPTGSHKDRCLSISISKAVELGHSRVILYSDGSAALSSAAYAARAGLGNIAVVPRGAPSFRLWPLNMYGSFILEYQGGSQEALDWVHIASKSVGIFETSTYRRANPYGVEGSKTIGLEIFEQLHGVPDWIVVPVGGGATLSGIWRAFLELNKQGRTTKLPRLIAVFPEGYDVLERALEMDLKTEDELRSLGSKDFPPTLQVKIAMPYPPDGLEAIRAIRESNGLIVYATDEEVMAAQKELGSSEGIYAEPSGVASLAGLEKLLGHKRLGTGETIVVVITGSGFRETGLLCDKKDVVKIPVDQSNGLKTLEDILQLDTREAQGADSSRP